MLVKTNTPTDASLITAFHCKPTLIYMSRDIIPLLSRGLHFAHLGCCFLHIDVNISIGVAGVRRNHSHPAGPVQTTSDRWCLLIWKWWAWRQLQWDPRSSEEEPLLFYIFFLTPPVTLSLRASLHNVSCHGNEISAVPDWRLPAPADQLSALSGRRFFLSCRFWWNGDPLLLCVCVCWWDRNHGNVFHLFTWHTFPVMTAQHGEKEKQLFLAAS